MLGQVRRVVLGACVALVVFASSAAAECAWVLWGHTVGDAIMDRKGWFIRATFDRRADCVKAYLVYLDDKRRLKWEVIGDQDGATGLGAVITYPVEMGGLTKYKENVVCRPDSVPPTRGGVLGS